ncbi:MAG: hypothetical protein LBD09_05410, partial [Treponema sp.]|nr:hypothetical protein [Treponema sp.]
MALALFCAAPALLPAQAPAPAAETPPAAEMPAIETPAAAPAAPADVTPPSAAPAGTFAPDTSAPAAETPADGSGRDGSYYLDQSGGEIRFIQRLAWAAGEYIFRYEVIIEKETSGDFAEVLREFTTAAFIEVSLPPGTYRYALRAYDLLDLPGELSDWFGFEILLALQPELRGFSPEGFFLDEDARWELSLNGRNIDPAAEIYLRHGNRSIVPAEKTVPASL